MYPEVVGIIGAGNFGQTVASLLAFNVDVLIWSRTAIEKQVLQRLQSDRKHRIQNTQDRISFCKQCKLIIPVVPSSNFREVIRDFSEHLHPYHILIHGTKGLDLVKVDLDRTYTKVSPRHVRTMSQVIREESRVVRVGAISGPNLSVEILAGMPAATVIASDYDEVVTLGHHVLSSPQFKIYGAHDLLGTELAGALKNMIAIGTGISAGLRLGKNIEALLITRGLREMLIIGQALGADPGTFFGTAGLGDLIATSTSTDSRNFRFGLRLGEGASVEEIEATSTDLVEGVRTIKLMYHLAESLQLDVPIVEVLFGMIYRKLPIHKAMEYLLDYPYSMDVDYIKLSPSVRFL
ncbi:MAG: NAD(P)H-dependent glycerol-3-phosphate dehydrogenase [Saprospiraceae bacterium]|nr:NAD(P)H-dependent glycerol-3-phosphate dehydrogenase [Saprospiraceae bacterium]